jgi:hypothetical protein
VQQVQKVRLVQLDYKAYKVILALLALRVKWVPLAQQELEQPAIQAQLVLLD